MITQHVFIVILIETKMFYLWKIFYHVLSSPCIQGKHHQNIRKEVQKINCLLSVLNAPALRTLLKNNLVGLGQDL
jgi:hypothetical protein